MKIGIDYRMLAAGAVTVNRGMGRYTQQQLREVLRLDQDNEYVLLCREESDTGAILEEIRDAPNVTISFMPTLASIVDRDPNDSEVAFRLAADYQLWLEDQQLDLYHATTPFLLGDLVLPFLDVCPLVATHYDLIPFIYQDHYFDFDCASVSRIAYMRALRFLAGADQIIAISNHVRRETRAYLAFPEDRAAVAYPIADPVFRRLPGEDRETSIAVLRERLGLEGDYFLAVSHFHHSKNLKTLFAAFQRVTRELGHRIPLVLTCHLLPPEKEMVRAWAEDFGIKEDLVIPGLVTDDELVGLYNFALAFIHPSRYEGFGLPVLEAMRCGAPVVTTTAASLPEVAGDAALLVDPDDVTGMSEAMAKLANSSKLREEFRSKGFKQARLFTPRQLGEATLRSYQRAASTPRRREHRQPRIAMWTPVPPQQTGIADYAAELLKPLADRADVEVFIDDGVMPDLELLDYCLIHHHSAFERRNNRKPFDVVICQIGASLFHVFVEQGLKTHGGVVVLHDLTWGFVHHAVASLSGDMTEFDTDLLEWEGEDALAEFNDIRKMPQPELTEALQDFFTRHYMLRPFIDATVAQVVHMPKAERDLSERYANAHPTTILMGVEDPRRSLPFGGWNPARDRFGIRNDDFVVGAFGIVDPVKRIDKIIEAIAWLHERDPDCGVKLIVVGSSVTKEYASQLAETARQLGVRDHVLFAGRVPRREMDEILLAVDAIVNLRYPFPKQMSATLMRGVAAGKPIITTDIEHWRFLPDDFVVRIPHGANEVEDLTRNLRRLIGDPDLRERMGLAARQYYEREATTELMADRYLELVEKVTGIRAQPVKSSSARKRRAVDDSLPLCKVWEVEDSSAQEIISALGELARDGSALGAPAGSLNPTSWSSAMALITLNRVGALSDSSSVIHIGAASNPLNVVLCEKCAEVFAVDCYGHDDLSESPVQMLFDPISVANRPFPAERLVVEAMDVRYLRVPDARFDAAVIAIDLPEVRTLRDLANVSYEVGRVLRPGGVATMSLRYRLAGPSGTSETNGNLSVSERELGRYVLEAGGLELVEDLQSTISQSTWESRRAFFPESDRPSPPAFIQTESGFCSAILHLALRRKKDSQPPDWARPSRYTFLPTSPSKRKATRGLDGKGVAQATEDSVTARIKGSGSSSQDSRPLFQVEKGQIWQRTDLPYLLHRWDQVRARSSVDDVSEPRRIRRRLGFLARTLRRIRDLGIASDLLRDLLQAIVDWQLSIVARLESLMRSVFPHVEDLETRTQGIRQDMDSLSSRVEFLKRDINELQKSDSDLGRFVELAVRAQIMIQEFEVRQCDDIQDKLARMTTLAKECKDFGPNLPKSIQEDRNLLSDLANRLFDIAASHVRRPFDLRPCRPAISLTKDQSFDLFTQLEKMDSTIASFQAVEVSVQDSMAEDVIVAAVAHFGDRMSCLAPERYRAPNDLWIHIDFTDRWARQNTWESALARLEEPHGRLVLVTQFDRAVPEVPGLVLIENVQLDLESAKVRVFFWGFPSRSPGES